MPDDNDDDYPYTSDEDLAAIGCPLRELVARRLVLGPSLDDAIEFQTYIAQMQIDLSEELEGEVTDEIIWVLVGWFASALHAWARMTNEDVMEIWRKLSLSME
jgi:hypothetical protein